MKIMLTVVHTVRKPKLLIITLHKMKVYNNMGEMHPESTKMFKKFREV